MSQKFAGEKISKKGINIRDSPDAHLGSELALTLCSFNSKPCNGESSMLMPSEETRRAYSRAVSEFFQSAGMKHPAEVVHDDVIRWRDRLRSQKKSAALPVSRPYAIRCRRLFKSHSRSDLKPC